MPVPESTRTPTQRRALLFSARLKLTPEIQPVRQTAIDKILEQNLLIADAEAGLDLKGIHDLVTISIPNSSPLFTSHDIEGSLNRLQKSNRVVEVNAPSDRYRLSEIALKEMWVIQEATEARMKRTLDKLFKDSTRTPEDMGAPFLKALGHMFSTLGELYVRRLLNSILDRAMRCP